MLASQVTRESFTVDMEDDSYLGAKLQKARCGRCDREMEKAHRLHLGTGYCANCYPRVFPPRTCLICGGVARSHYAQERPTCRKCHLQEQTCLRCGKATPRGDLRVGDQVACASCARYYKPAKPCDVCGTPSQRLTRVLGREALGRMCERCLRRETCATCSQCKKHRTVFFMLLSREPVCKGCAVSPEASHPCPDCGTSVGGSSNARCLSCSIKRSNWSKAEAAVRLMAAQQVQRLTVGFVGWANQAGRESMAAAGFSRYLDALIRIDNALTGSDAEVDNAVLMELFTTEELRSMGMLAQYLGDEGLLTADSDQRLEASLNRLVSKKLQDIEGKPWAEDVRRFHRFLLAREKPLSLRTIKSYLNAAIQLLKLSGVASASQLTQANVDRYFKKFPGSKASSTVFFSYLRGIGSVSVQGGKAKTRPTNLRQRAKQVRRIQDRLAEVTARRDRVPLVAKLLSILFGVPLEYVLRMRHEHLDVTPSDERIFLKNDWLAVPEEIVGLVRELTAAPESQKQSGRSWVFPGRLVSDHLSTEAVKYHLEKLAS